MSLFFFIGMGRGSNAPIFSMSSSVVSKNTVNGFTVFANHEWRSDGIEYENSNPVLTTVDSSRGAYLENGTASDYWIARTIDSGTLDTDGIGATRQVLNATYKTGITKTTSGSGGGSKTATVTFNIYDAASGGNLMDTCTIVFTASEDPV